MTSATPRAPWRVMSSAMSVASSVAPADSNGEAGTQLDAYTAKVNGSGAAASISARMPGTPSTLASSWGSAATAVVPAGSTVETNSSIHSLVDSRCMWASTKPGRERRSADIDHLPGLALAPAGDHPVGQRQRSVDPFPGGIGEHPAAGDERVGGLVAARHRERAGSRLGSGHRLTLFHKPRTPAAGARPATPAETPADDAAVRGGAPRRRIRRLQRPPPRAHMCSASASPARPTAAPLPSNFLGLAVEFNEIPTAGRAHPAVGQPGLRPASQEPRPRRSPQHPHRRPEHRPGLVAGPGHGPAAGRHLRPHLGVGRRRPRPGAGHRRPISAGHQSRGQPHPDQPGRGRPARQGDHQPVHRCAGDRQRARALHGRAVVPAQRPGQPLPWYSHDGSPVFYAPRPTAPRATSRRSRGR